MIDHLELNVTDLARATHFYAQALAPLGYTCRVAGPPTGFGASPDRLDFWLRPGDASTPRPHFAFNCTDRDRVIACFEAAVATGAPDRGPPSVLTRIHPTYFAAFVFDPDGHLVEFVCHT